MFKKSFLARGTLSSAVLIGAVLVPGAAHAASQPACGDVLHESVTLTADLGPCPSTGLIIGENDITVDLGGHRIIGPNAGGTAPGVVVTARTNAKIQNGTIMDFARGVALRGGSGHLVQRLVLQNNLGTSDPVPDSSAGIVLFASRNNTVINNVVNQNGSIAGIRLNQNATGNLISHNAIINNNLPVRGSTVVEDSGIRVQGNSGANTISENAISGSGLDGIQIEAGANGNTVQRNSVSGNGFNGHVADQRQGGGIRVSSDSNTVQQNVVTGNAANGILVEGGSNRILGNIARGNNAAHDTSRPAFDLRDTNTDPPCGTNTWTANQADTRNPSCAT